MRVEVEGRAQKRELVTLEQARRQLTGLGFWSQDLTVQDVKIVPIPEVDHSKLGLQRDGVTFPILDRAGLWRELGMSSKFLGEYEGDPELVANMIQHNIRKRVGRSLRFSGHHRGVTTVKEPSGTWFPPLEVFDIVATELKGNVEDIDLGKKALDMRFIGEYSAEPPTKPGDVLHAGLVVRMNGNVKVGPYCYRMVCANGAMTMFETLQTAPTRDMIVSAIRTAVLGQYNAGRQLTDRLIGLDAQPFEGNREQMIIRLGHDSGLPARFVAKALERLPELPDQATMYDLMNIVTQLAGEMRRPEKIQMRAGRMINYLAAQHAHCHSCGHVVDEN